MTPGSWRESTGSILVVGGGIGGLTAAIALGRHGFAVEVIEREPVWSVYGVGIVQQANVIRAMAGLGILEGYVGAGFPFDGVEIVPPGASAPIAIPSPKLTEDYPPNLGISRRALHDVLVEQARAAGATIRLGVTVDRMEDDGREVAVQFGDGTQGRYGVVVGADGIHSTARATLFPSAPPPHFTGQGCWRYNMPRASDVTTLRFYHGAVGAGLMPISDELMYVYMTTSEPENPYYPRQGLAATMAGKLVDAHPEIARLAGGITDDAGVVYRPLEAIFLEGDWHRGRVVLIGDAVHATTPHLGQGAGMAIEDAIVLADELARADTIEDAFRAYRDRRYERCRFIYETSLMVGDAQLARREPIDFTAVNRRMFEVTAQPI